MALPKFDEWKRPWKDEEFDAERAAKLIYDLHKDKEKLTESKATLVTERDEALTARKAAEKKVTDLEDKDLPEIERLRKENERLKADPPAPTQKKTEQGSDDFDIEKARLEIALDKGLTKTQVKRLTGSTMDELVADADAYIEEHGLSTNAGTGGQAPPSQRAKVTTGTKQRKDEDIDTDADLDPGALYDKTHGITPVKV
jgi:ribosomal protein L12E/L44/L45/RPP1/RPP2